MTSRRFYLRTREGWQNGYCTSLENWRPQGLGGSNPSPSVVHCPGALGAGPSLASRDFIVLKFASFVCRPFNVDAGV